jgi:hypothetical protein
MPATPARTRRALRRTALTLGSTVAATVLAVSVSMSPAAAASSETRTATVSANQKWEWITHDLTNPRAGYNLYIRFDRVPESIVIRWVKCGYVSDQYEASSVGGAAKWIQKDSDWGGALGTGFRAGSCVRIWAIGGYVFDSRKNYPIEAYFSDHYLP